MERRMKSSETYPYKAGNGYSADMVWEKDF
jgi:hypothetical protein